MRISDWSSDVCSSDRYLGAGLCCLGTFVPFVHLAPFARDHGLSRLEGVWLVGLIGVGSTLGRFVLGAAADRMGRGRAVALVILLTGLALLRSEAHTSELQSLMRISYAVFCLEQKHY